jgi:hypothetical protein
MKKLTTTFKQHFESFIWFNVFLYLVLLTQGVVFGLLKQLHVKSDFLRVNIPMFISAVLSYIVLNIIFSALIKKEENKKHE